MTIVRSAYDTTACHGYLINKTIDALLQAYHSGQLAFDNAIYTVEGGASIVNAIPAFAHPIDFTKHDKHQHEKIAINIAVDVRQYGKKDERQNVFVIRNDIEYKLAIHRGSLNRIWLAQSPSILRDISPVPMMIFSSWLSESLGKRYALDPREQLNIAILSAIFYSSQFTNDSELDEQSKLRVVGSVTKATKASAKDVLEIIDKVSVVHNTTDFCKHAYEISGSVRLKELNAGVLYSVLGGSWFGTNAKEMIAVAIEHPPTWLSILMSAYTERSYKNSQITKLLDRLSTKDSGKNYMQAILNLLKHNSN